MILGRTIKGKSPAQQGEPFTVSVIVPGAAAQTAANYSAPFFIADAAIEVIEVKERHEVVGSDGGAVTVMLKKVASGTAPAAGTDMLAAGISLKATADTNQTPSLSATVAARKLTAGQALALVTTGTLTAVVGVSMTVKFRYI